MNAWNKKYVLIVHQISETSFTLTYWEKSQAVPHSVWQKYQVNIVGCIGLPLSMMCMQIDKKI
jgi:hypothetical protein